MAAEIESDENVSENLGRYSIRSNVNEKGLVNLNSRTISAGMTDDEILEAAARITAARWIEEKAMRIAELERQERELERKDELLRDYAEENLRGWGLISYTIQDSQLVAAMKAGEDRLAIEVCGFSNSGSIISLNEIQLNLSSAFIITHGLKTALAKMDHAKS